MNETIEQNEQEQNEETVIENLRQALSASQAEAESLRQNLAQRDKEEQRRQYRDHLRTLLEDAGANPAALELMTLQGDALAEDGKSPEEAAEMMRGRWGDLFTTRKALPMKQIAPQGAGLTLTREDVRNMSPEEINRSWSMVKSILAQPY